jgi:hypothetical protein
MTIPEKSNSCVGVDLPGGGRVHAEGLCACGGQFEAAPEPETFSRSIDVSMLEFAGVGANVARMLANAHLRRVVEFPVAAPSLPALPQPLGRLTAALDELDAVSGELSLEDVLSVYARRLVSANSEPSYSLSRGGESVRCAECDCAHGKHAEDCTIGAAYHLLALIWRKRSAAKNISTKEAEPNERSARASEGMRVPGQHREWIDRRFTCLT